MDNQGREYRYQADYSAGGQMFHVRCDDWEEFKIACDNVGIAYETIKETVTTTTFNPGIAINPVAPTAPYSANPYPTPEGESACKTCGAPTLPEKKIVGKDGRSWWVRDCTTGDRTHKGPIRPAS